MNETTTSTNFEKYQTGNPLMQKIILRFLARVCREVQDVKPASIIDIGCGEGLVAQELGKLGLDYRYRGFDISPEAVEMARQLNPGLSFEVSNIFETEPEPGAGDLAICLEVLEHLEDPGGALARIAQWTSKTAILSVPWEPWFRLGNRMRGKYPETKGNHPEHIQQFKPATFGKLVGEHFSTVEIKTCFPWIMAVARR